MLIRPTADPILTRLRAALDTTYGGRIEKRQRQAQRISPRLGRHASILLYASAQVAGSPPVRAAGVPAASPASDVRCSRNGSRRPPGPAHRDVAVRAAAV